MLEFTKSIIIKLILFSTLTTIISARTQASPATNHETLNTVQTSSSQAKNKESIYAGKEMEYLDSTVIALRAQLQLMKRYDDRLLNTVYWALGAIGTIFVVIVSLGWYTNFRVYQKDIAALGTSFEGHIIDETTKIRDELIKDISDRTGKAKADIKEFANRDLNQLKLEVDKKIHKISSDIKWIEIKRIHGDAKRWEEQGVFSNTLRALSDIIPVAVGSTHEWYIEDVILEDIQRVLAMWDKKQSDVIVKITQALGILPKRYAVAVENITAMCKS